jgi:hypothetical protein
MRGRPLAFTLLAMLAVSVRARAHEPALSRYNYREHVRPLFLKHCGGCHRPGGAGPMSLLDYQEAVPWAKAIGLEVLQRKMPPFLPGDEGGPFRTARSLTAQEIDVLVDWSVGATPEGTPLAASGDPLSKSDGWTGGEPDLVLEPAVDVILGEDESEKIECVLLPTRLGAARVLSAIEVRPLTSARLRRAAVKLGASCREGEPVLTWLPDQHRVSFPDGLGRELPPGASLALELLYVKGWADQGETTRDRSSLGIWFSGTATPVRSVRIDGAGRLARGAVAVVALYPDPAASSATEGPLRIDAIHPDGSTRLLLAADAFDPQWAEKYFLLQPLELPAGAQIRSSGAPLWIDFIQTPITE